MRTLDTHLASCSACAELDAQQMELDRLLRQSLRVVGDGGSIRANVKARIAAQATSPTRGAGVRRGKRGRWTLRSILLPGWVGMSVALAVTFVTVFLPQFGPNTGGGVPSAGAASHLVRKNIGYPFALDPARRDHLLAGAGGQIYESWNAGQGWRRLAPLPAGLVIRALVIDAARPNRYLVATLRSVFVSEDAGHHWRRTASGLPGATNMFIIQDPHSPHTFYLGPSTLWKSTDAGLSWSRAGRGAIFAPYGIQALQPGPGKLLYTAIWGGGVATSSNGGVTWQRHARGLARHVMDVAVSSNGVLWAASDRGTYRSSNGGRLWQRFSPRTPFFATSVLPGPGYVLVGGDATLYRSRDGGRHWQLAMNGLPLGPSINSLVADPYHPHRVYASLNSDGIFRSDDAGRHWVPMNTGLPLSVGIGSSRALLFLRGGALWITDGKGADPELLTVEQDVTMATLAPDGAAVAYLAVTPDSWAVRVVGSGGSSPVTLATGKGAVPTMLRWSADSSLVAIDLRSGVSVNDLSSEHWRWTVPPTQRLLGWAPGGRSLLFWDRSTGRIVARSWNTGVQRPDGQAVIRTLPILSPNGARIALISRGSLASGYLPGPIRATPPVVAGCRLLSWSNDNRSLFLRCGRELVQRSPNGSLLARVKLHSGTTASAAPDGTILLFRRGKLWSWNASAGLKKIINGATPAA
jgi:photosystem II stability/assembly factor-like uncharacterized protein